MAASSKSAHDETTLEANVMDEKSNTVKEDLGYYFYPDREEKKKKSYFERVIFHEDINNFKCRNHVQSCILANPKVKLLLGALASHGCLVDAERHISCESCRSKVSGGFDPKTMQVVMCQNNIRNRDTACNVLAHELLHAFDFCRAKVNFENLRHLACSEIRAANMFHCSLGAALSTGEASVFGGIKERHQFCVKNKALESVMLVRNVSKLEAMTIVDEVFDKCYNDTEPFGRQCFKNLGRAKRALEEARNYYDFE